MKTLNLVQGSPEWNAHRAKHFNASDAAAMLGCSPYKTRAQLLREMHTGLVPEVDVATAKRIENGHRVEALARPLAEEIIGEDLYPVTGTEGNLSASFDGLTLLEDTGFEHKALSAKLKKFFESGAPMSELPKHYRVQMEQQLHVSGAQRVLFMSSAWDGDTLVEEHHGWYYPDAELRAEILRGWEQFAADLAAYEPPAAVAPAAVAAPMESLPAVQVRMDGALVVHSNLDAFGEALRAFIAKIPAQPSTDQEFADCEAACKSLKRAEEALEAEEARALAGMADVEKMRRIVSDLAGLARSTRLQREKLVKARKEQLRTEQVQRGRAALAAHLQGLNRTLGGGFMPDIPADFAGAIAGKKSLASIADAIDTELNRAKIAASQAAQAVQENLNTLREHAEHRHLFPDVGAIVQKKPEDLQALVAARIAQHRAAEEKRLEAERARIRAEEEAKLRREQEQREAEQRRQQEQEARQAVEAAKPALPPAPAPNAAPAVSQQADVVPIRRPPAGPPSLRIGEIANRLGFGVTEHFLRMLGFTPSGKEGASKLYHEHEWPAMCDALIAHVQAARDRQREAA